MFSLFVNVGAVYIYHRHSKQFLGMGSRTPHGNQGVGVVRDTSSALDFRIGEGAKAIVQGYNPKSLSEVTEDPKTPNMRISHPTSNTSFDSETGVNRYGNRLILYPQHNAGAQIMKVVMLSDFTFLLTWNDKCFNYDEPTGGFVTGACNDVSKSKFEFFFETTPTKKEEPAQCPLLPTDSEFSTKDVINYQTGTSANFNGRNPDEMTSLIFKDGKAIKSGKLGDTDGIRFNHQILDLKDSNYHLRPQEQQAGKKSSSIFKKMKRSKRSRRSSEEDTTTSSSSSSDYDSNELKHQIHKKRASYSNRRKLNQEHLKHRKYV